MNTNGPKYILLYIIHFLISFAFLHVAFASEKLEISNFHKKASADCVRQGKIVGTAIFSKSGEAWHGLFEKKNDVSLTPEELIELMILSSIRLFDEDSSVSRVEFVILVTPYRGFLDGIIRELQKTVNVNTLVNGEFIEDRRKITETLNSYYMTMESYRRLNKQILKSGIRIEPISAEMVFRYDGGNVFSAFRATCGMTIIKSPSHDKESDK